MTALGIAKPDPDEVKQLMEGDPGQFAGIRRERLIKDDAPLAEEAGGVHLLSRTGTVTEPAAPGAKIASPAEAHWRPSKAECLPRAQAYFFGEPLSRYCGSRTSSWTLF